MEFTRDGIIEFMKAQGRIFDIVRLVDVSLAVEYEIGEQNEFVPREYNCYAVWNKERRCENCISAKAFALKTRLTKFEFVNDEVFYVMSAYTLVDGEPYMLEMVLKLNDETLFGTFGKNEFAHAEGCPVQRKVCLPAGADASDGQQINRQITKIISLWLKLPVNSGKMWI